HVSCFDYPRLGSRSQLPPLRPFSLMHDAALTGDPCIRLPANGISSPEECDLLDKLRTGGLFLGLAGLLLSAAGIWWLVLTSPIKYCYRTVTSLACFHDIRGCKEYEELETGTITGPCKWEDDPFNSPHR